MIFNARITAVDEHAGRTARGLAVTRPVALAAPIPCALAMPGERHRRTAEAHSVAVDEAVALRSAALAVSGWQPSPGDRVTIEAFEGVSAPSSRTLIVTHAARRFAGAAGAAAITDLLLAAAADQPQEAAS